MQERRVQRRFIEAAIVIDPAPEGGIDYTCQVFQGFVTTLVQCPSPHGPPDIADSAVRYVTLLAKMRLTGIDIYGRPRDCKCF